MSPKEFQSNKVNFIIHDLRMFVAKMCYDFCDVSQVVVRCGVVHVTNLKRVNRYFETTVIACISLGCRDSVVIIF